MTTNNSLIGFNGKTHDSKSEAEASYTFASLGCIPCNDFLPCELFDKEGVQIRSKSDFYHPAADLFIEYKDALLNSKTSKRTAENGIQNRLERNGSLSTFDYICHGWNHSRYSKALATAALTPQRYVVVFKKPPTANEALAYCKAGIVFCHLAALPSYLAYVRLAKRGLDVGFWLTYMNDEGIESTFTLH